MNKQLTKIWPTANTMYSQNAANKYKDCIPGCIFYILRAWIGIEVPIKTVESDSAALVLLTE